MRYVGDGNKTNAHVKVLGRFRLLSILSRKQLGKRRKINKLAEVKEWLISNRYGDLRSWYGFLANLTEVSLFGSEQRKRDV